MYKPFTNEADMIKPVIHMNGTSAQTLLAQLEQANSKLRDALEALEDATPNARDYYPLESESPFHQAQHQHRLRLAAIGGILEDLRLLAEHIDTQRS